MKRTSKTYIRTLRLCVRFKYAFIAVFNRFYLSFEAHKQNIYPYTSFVCTLQVRFYRSFQPFLSIVWIYLNRLQNTGAKLFRILKTCPQAHKQHKYQPRTQALYSALSPRHYCCNLFTIYNYSVKAWLGPQIGVRKGFDSVVLSTNTILYAIEIVFSTIAI